MNYRSVGVLDTPDIFFDYLTLERTTVTLKAIDAQRGDFAHVSSFMGEVVYQGIVSDIQTDGKTTTLSLSPLLSLFDLTVTYDRTDLQTGALEDFIASVISDLYITNPDTLERIPMSVTTTSSTPSALNIKSNVHEFYDIITKALTMYGIVVKAVFDPATKAINVTVGKVTESAVIEADLDNIIGKNFVIGDAYGDLNKSTYINKDNEAERVTYYLHTDGTVDTVNADRITPVFSAVEYIEGSEDFWADAQTRALEALTPRKYDNLIELTVALGDRVVTCREVGTLTTILGDKSYNSILTGYERSGETIKLIFGCIREELTKKLILERRKNA
jgi:hypothetical protein